MKKSNAKPALIEAKIKTKQKSQIKAKNAVKCTNPEKAWKLLAAHEACVVSGT